MSSSPAPGTEARARPSARSASWPTIATVIGGLFVVWSLAIGLDTIGDNSFFTHLATGRVLIDGEFPRHDLYSFTASGDPWVVQSWLASLIYGWLDSWFGIAGIRVVTGLITATIGGLTWMLTRPARTLGPRIAITGLVVSIGATMWAPRPLIFGLLFLTVVLFCVEGRVPAPVMLPLFWCWANTHGSFPLGLVAIVCFAIGTKLDGSKPEVELRALKWAAGGTLAAVIGPLGPDVLLFPVRLLGRQDVLQQVVEWQSPDFADTWSRIFLVQVLLATILLVRKPSYRVAIPLVVFTAAALLGLRNVSLASLVLIPGLAVSMKGMGSVDGKESGPVAKVGLALVCIVGLVAGSLRLGQPDLDLSAYPVDAIAWMDQSGLRTPDSALATSDIVGNYLELVEGRDARAFLDDRFDMYPDSVVNDYLVLLHGSPGWEQVLDEHGITQVLWDRNAPLVQLLAVDDAWKTVYGDDSWTVLCLRGSTNC